MIKVWEHWVPRWAPGHIEAKYEPRTFDHETGMPEEQKVECHCNYCGADWHVRCVGGNARRHIQKFAMIHLHGILPRET